MSDISIDPEVLALFEAALQRALEDKQTEADLEVLAKAGVNISVEKIRADVRKTSLVVLEHVQTMLNGWRGAEDRLNEMLAARRQRIRDAFSRRLGLLVVVLGTIGFLVLPRHLRALPVLLLVIPVLPAYLRLVGLFVLDRTLITRERAATAAKERFLEALETQMTVVVREAINRRLISFDTEFQIFDRRGLRQLADPDREVSTEAAEELKALIASLDSGSIGLSGPRGCGKTTLIRSFTEGRSMPFSKERVGLTVSAPVKYDAREFVLHLFASLCETVLRARPDDLARSGSRWAQARQKRALRLIGAAALGLITAGWVFIADPEPPGREPVGIGLLIVGGMSGYFWLAASLERTSTGRSIARRLYDYLGVGRPEGPPRLAAERAARDYLKQIRFQQSHEVGKSAELSLPFGLSLGGTGSTALARTPWTLPEAVEEFRRFATVLSDRYVVIGIDELDKMESDKAAREFLNNVKGVFGVAGCYYLVSVSEDAMAAFERRGLPLRDVFDSSFDEIQQVKYLKLSESRMVLESRVTGVPIPFQCLCHCLAGGLPRDLIRVTRELVHHYDAKEAEPESADTSLKGLSSSLVKAEWRGKLVGATAAGHSVERQPWWLTRWLHRQTQEELNSDALRERTLELGGLLPLLDAAEGKDDDDVRKAHRIAIEMMVFNYYAATALELFGDDQLGVKLRDQAEPGELASDGAAMVETLAISRQQFSVDPWLAWGLVEETRRMASLTPWEDLRPPLPGSESGADNGGSAAGAAAAPVG